MERIARMKERGKLVDCTASSERAVLVAFDIFVAFVIVVFMQGCS